jgi:hypothetical protein
VPTTETLASAKVGSKLNIEVSEIISHALWMQKEVYRRSTIESAVSSLKGTANRANLLDRELVKLYPGVAQLAQNRKEALAISLARFYEYKGIACNPPLICFQDSERQYDPASQ